MIQLSTVNFEIVHAPAMLLYNSLAPGSTHRLCYSTTVWHQDPRTGYATLQQSGTRIHAPAMLLYNSLAPGSMHRLCYSTTVWHQDPRTGYATLLQSGTRILLHLDEALKNPRRVTPSLNVTLIFLFLRLLIIH
jgi:hypothetical protein